MSAPNELASVRIGCVKYLNARPLIHGWRGEVHFDHPTALCRQLAAGELDLALVSSFEYLRHPTYAVIDEVAIASHGPVYSVILAHLGEIEDLGEIVIDPASKTSVNLLRCLLGQRGLAPEFVAAGEITGRRGRLFIGDQAIQFRAKSEDRYRIMDLGAEWKKQRELPFVYALWLMRPEVKQKHEIAETLRSLGARNRANLDSMIAAEPQAERAFCEFYFRDCLRFTFADEEKEGFQKFAESCVGQNLLPRVPPAPELI